MVLAGGWMTKLEVLHSLRHNDPHISTYMHPRDSSSLFTFWIVKKNTLQSNLTKCNWMWSDSVLASPSHKTIQVTLSFQYSQTEVKSTSESNWLLPGSCQNKGNATIECLNQAFGVTAATRAALVRLGRDFRVAQLHWRDATAFFNKHFSPFVSCCRCWRKLLFCAVTGSRRGGEYQHLRKITFSCFSGNQASPKITYYSLLWTEHMTSSYNQWFTVREICWYHRTAQYGAQKAYVVNVQLSELFTLTT